MSDTDAAVLRHAIAMGGWLSAHGVTGTDSDHGKQMLRLVAAGPVPVRGAGCGGGGPVRTDGRGPTGGAMSSPPFNAPSIG